MSDHYVSLFPYVDFFYMKGDKPTKWERIAVDEIGERSSRVGSFNTYVSVQQFGEPEQPKTADAAELHYAPPYMDFDSTDVAECQRDVLKVIDFLKTDLDLDDSEIRIWFSGQKGFHLVLSPTAFGVTPSTDLTYVYKRMFLHIREYLGLTSLDGVVYTKRRMWRVPRTVHKATGLYKRELSHDEVTLSVDDIKDLARDPGDDLVSTEDFSAFERPLAVEFFSRFRDEYKAEKEAAEVKVVTLHPEAAPGDPVCVTDIMTGGLKKPGDRNKATLVLASYNKDAGRPVEEAVATLTDWAVRLPLAHRRSDDAYVKANTASVVKTIYETPGYHFACNFIRSLHGDKAGGKSYERVACAGDSCPFIKGDITAEGPIDVHLSQIGQPEYIDRPVKVRLRVAGRTESPYLIPKDVEIFATADDCDRTYCALHAAGGRIDRDLTKDLRVVVAMCNVPDQQQTTVIKELLAKGSCKKFAVNINSYAKVMELAAVPKAESAVGDKGGTEVAGDYTYLRMYALVEKDFRINNYYEVVGRVYPHPKTQQATLVVTEAEPLQDVIEDFDLDAAMPLFKAYEQEFPVLIGDLLADLSINVTKVAGRKYALLGALMTMHAPLHLNIGDERYGGWLQTLIVGDTGEAKSQLVERLMRHVGLGELVNAQNAGRTGLLYTIVNKDTTHNFIQWGSFVLNDRGLLAIDEASGLEKAEYAELRNARRDGVFKVTRSVTGEASTRTRLLMLSNPRFGKNMHDFGAGIEAVTALFENADIRRFDLVMGFRAGAVPHESIEEELSEDVDHVFTSDVVRANMLWAWSRKSDEIYWTAGTMEAVKGAAKRLNKTYAGSGIHLLSQDATEKIARMSQAVAATFHSSDDLHQMLYVRPEHVAVVEDLIKALYSAEDLEYDTYVRQNSESEDFDFEKAEFELERKLDAWGGCTLNEVFDVFARNKAVNNFALEAIAGESKIARNIAKELMKTGLVKQGQRGGLEKTPRLNEMLRRWHRKTGK